MKIVIGADHAGYEVKEHLGELLRRMGHDVNDVGARDAEPCDYPDFAAAAAREVASGRAERGVLVCASGIGMTIAANKAAGIRAALVMDERMARMSRTHNDANVFCAAARLVPEEKIAACLRIWLETPFEGGRHARRLEKISRLEQGPGKR